MSLSFFFVPKVPSTEQVLNKCLLIWNLWSEPEAKETENSYSSISTIQCHDWRGSQVIFLLLQNQRSMIALIQLLCQFPMYYSFLRHPCYIDVCTETILRNVPLMVSFLVFLCTKRKTINSP